MKDKLLLFCAFLFVSLTVFAQDALKIEEFTTVSINSSNVVIEIPVTDAVIDIEQIIQQTEANSKSGFSAACDDDMTTLTLSFQEEFNAKELRTLLRYSGITMHPEAFTELLNLINQ